MKSKFFSHINWWRFIKPIILGLSINLIIRLVFRFIYPNRPHSFNQNQHNPPVIIHYAIVCILAIIVMEGITLINKQLDKCFSWHNNPFKRFLLHFITSTIYTFMAIMTLAHLVSWAYNGQPINTHDKIIVVTVSVTVITLFQAIDTVIFMLKRWRDSLAEIERFKKESIEFQFEMLKNQVNPHFLFNSLNTLSSLIFTNQETAAEFVRQLAKVYRYVLENHEKELITLYEELTFLSSYCFLIEMRFAPCLHFNINISDNSFNQKIMPMTLQMLIENAIKHNILSQKKPLAINVIITDDDFLEITNNLQPKTHKEYSSGLGLKNIKSRYAYLTSRPVEVTQTEQVFRVRIPLIS